MPKWPTLLHVASTTLAGDSWTDGDIIISCTVVFGDRNKKRKLYLFSSVYNELPDMTALVAYVYPPTKRSYVWENVGRNKRDWLQIIQSWRKNRNQYYEFHNLINKLMIPNEWFNFPSIVLVENLQVWFPKYVSPTRWNPYS